MWLRNSWSHQKKWDANREKWEVYLLLWALVSTNPKTWTEKFGKNNSRGKEKHGRMASPKPIVNMVSRMTWESAVSSKSNSERCVCAGGSRCVWGCWGPWWVWCQLHGGNKSSVRLRTDGRSVSKDYEYRLLFQECLLWIGGDRGVYNSKGLQFPGRELRLSCRKWDSQRWRAYWISRESRKRRKLMFAHCHLLQPHRIFTTTISSFM